MNSSDFSIYAQRRNALASQIGPGGVAILPTAPEQQRNRDSDFLFRHDSYFYYLSGFTEPHAWLVITGDGQTTLFCQPKDLEREIWDGMRLGPEAAPADAGGGRGIFAVQELDAPSMPTCWMGATLSGTRLPPTRAGDARGRLAGWSARPCALRHAGP
jgi:Xaa-Pro aminopeptidase